MESQPFSFPFALSLAAIEADGLSPPCAPEVVYNLTKGPQITELTDHGQKAPNGKPK